MSKVIIVCGAGGKTSYINNISKKYKSKKVIITTTTKIFKTENYISHIDEETFKNRFNVYLDKTSELLDYYDKLGLLKKIEINNSDSAADTYLKIKKVINSD